ncbi:MAG: alpha/beta hydrolase [bacterium]|nr:alpha/beta hydrolase [bacterium]
MERITYTTFDGVHIVGDWMTSQTTYGAALLLHMMPSDRKSWASFQAKLAEKGIASLAIDLRGHGESDHGQADSRLDYKTFSIEEHQSSLNDVTDAFAWIRRRGLEPARIVVCGASIGANFALQLLGEEPQCAGAALLSPGKDYHGLMALEDVQRLLNTQALWACGSETDDQVSFETAKELIAETPSEEKVFVPVQNAGHGTTIFEKMPEIEYQLADWVLHVIQGG